MENNTETNFIKIMELNKDEELIEKITNLLTENNIKFKLDLEENWTTPYKYAKYIPKFSIYVEENYEKEAIKLIEEYTKLENPVDEELLKEEENDPTEKQARRVKNFRKIYVGTFIALVFIAFIICVVYNIVH